MPKTTVHCSICGYAVSGYNFQERMEKLRRHRKKKHPKAHKKSVKKTLETKRRKGLINKTKEKKIKGNPQSFTLGKLVAMVYRTDKFGDGKNYYRHIFKKGKQPEIKVRKGVIRVVGNYRVLPEQGIVD